MPQTPSRRSRIKEYPAPPEVVDQWKNRRVYSKSGKVFGWVRSLFDRVGFNHRRERVTWLVIRWQDRKVTTVSLREGNLKLRDDGHHQIA
jgi:hypothetical protein